MFQRLLDALEVPDIETHCKAAYSVGVNLIVNGDKNPFEIDDPETITTFSANMYEYGADAEGELTVRTHPIVTNLQVGHA